MKMVKWLASFHDPDEADKFLMDSAAKLRKLGIADRFGVRIRTEFGVHHIELWEYDSQ